MNQPDPHLLTRAAECYQRLGDHGEAARCYREARSHRRAADLYAGLRRYHDAATDYAQAGLADLGAWILVHHAGDSRAAGEQLASLPTPVTPSTVLTLRRRLVLARCDVADGHRAPAGLPDTGLAVLADVCVELAQYSPVPDQYLERWAVALAEAMERDDQVALVFAAAVRGRRPGAAQRWRTWAQQVLHTDLILPSTEPTPAVSGNAPSSGTATPTDAPARR